MLQVRVGDMRQTPLAEAHVRLFMICNQISDEGEMYPFEQVRGVYSTSVCTR